MTKYIRYHDGIEKDDRGRYHPVKRKELDELVEDENVPLENIDVSRITDMHKLFCKTNGMNRKDFSGIETWDVSHVIDMCSMFSITCISMHSMDIGGWDVSNVRDMSQMFAMTVGFNADISGWDVSNVRDMSNMFHGAKLFDCDLSRWNVSKVCDMWQMFSGASSYKGDPRAWKNVAEKPLAEALESLAWREKK